MSWNDTIISDVCEVIAGQSPAGKYYNSDANGLPFYQGKKEFGQKQIGNPKKWTTHVTKEAFAGDVLMSVRAPVGPINYSTQHICIGRGLAAIRPSKKILREFLYYGLLAKQNEISGSEGAVFASINKSQIGKIKFPTPSIDVQKRIVVILDEAFMGIDKAIENTEKNLANTKELFESYLNNVFMQQGDRWEIKPLNVVCDVRDGTHDSPKYVEQGIPFVTQKNIRSTGLNFDKIKYITQEDHNKFYKRSNVAVDDILISMIGVNRGMSCVVDDNRIFSIKNVGLIKKAFRVVPKFLLFYLKSSYAKAYIEQESRGGAQPFIGLTKLRNMPIAITDLVEQNEIVKKLNNLSFQCIELENNYKNKLSALKKLKQSLLQKAFSGELTSSVVIDTRSPEYAAMIMVWAYGKHKSQNREKTFGHVKAEKISHLYGAICEVDLGRKPLKFAAGPYDKDHMKRMESWAKKNNYFEFKKRDGGYDFIKLPQFSELLTKSKTALAENKDKFTKLLNIIIPMNKIEIEVLATVHAAWNNLLLSAPPPSNDEIIYEARENWHPDKLKIDRKEFRDAIYILRENGMIPKGIGKPVLKRQESFI